MTYIQTKKTRALYLNLQLRWNRHRLPVTTTLHVGLLRQGSQEKPSTPQTIPQGAGESTPQTITLIAATVCVPKEVVDKTIRVPVSLAILANLTQPKTPACAAHVLPTTV
jgi:hypothetical protein